MNARQSLRWCRPDTNFREIRPERLITLMKRAEAMNDGNLPAAAAAGWSEFELMFV